MNSQENKIIPPALLPALTALYDSIYPRTCPVCDRIVPPHTALIHRRCMEQLSFVRRPICKKCGKQVLTESQKFCYDCAHNSHTFIKGRAMLNYDDTAQRIMSGIKYRNRREHAEIISRMLAYRLKDFIAEMDPDCMVPVPVHKSRLRERGYNQAQLFAEHISRETGIPVRSDILFRTKHTAAMKNLDPKERQANLEEAFLVREEAFDPEKGGRPQHIMLIDDIYTTGATAEACAGILRKHGIGMSFLCVCIGSDI